MFILNVPFAEKDAASSLGAEWNGTKWYVPDHIDLKYFIRWIPEEDLEIANDIIAQQDKNNEVSLSNLLRDVKNGISNYVKKTYWVNAEIANIQSHKNGNLYLELIELDGYGKEIAKSRAVILSRNVGDLTAKFEMATEQQLSRGMKVLLKVSVSFDVKYHLSLLVNDINPDFTLGGIEVKLNKIRNLLRKSNIFDLNKKLKVPKYFKKIAVVSPDGAAGLGDFQADANKLEKYNICKFKYYTATFQGNTVSKDVSKAIDKANFDAIKENFDAIVVIRGGGAKTDLNFLNEFDIAKSIASARVPVFTGIGHERDKVILDEVSNISFDTPSKVINFIANQNIEMYKAIKYSSDKIMLLIGKWVNAYKNNINSKEAVINEQKKSLILEYKRNISSLSNKINENIYMEKTKYKLSLEETLSKIEINKNSVMSNYKNENSYLINKISNDSKLLISKYKESVNSSFSMILQKSPMNALNNGYAILKDFDGKIITTCSELEKKESFIIMMSDGEKRIKNGE